MGALIPERLAALPALQYGAHDDADDGMCVMEAVAYVAGEPWTDHPICACPVISTFMRTWNDGLPSDEERDRVLKPLIPRLVGSRSTTAVEHRRADLALDWLVRVRAPAWLDLNESLRVHASAMRALPPLLSQDAWNVALPTIRAAAAVANAARDAAEDAASALPACWAAACNDAVDAAGDAAWAAARDAAAAAGDAASDAADAAWAAARAVADAARAADRDAADAARAADWDAAMAAPVCVTPFALTSATLERSAFELIDRMLAVGDAIDPPNEVV